MTTQTLVKKTLPQNPDIEVLLPNFKEPILPVNHGGFGWYGLMAYNEQGQLMCHECGKFSDELGYHLRKHKLSPRAYKERYGLRMLKRLVSATAYAKHHRSMMNRPNHKEAIAKLQAGRDRYNKAYRRPMPTASLEALNAHDTCLQQILRRLIDASRVYGPGVTAEEVRKHDGGLDHLTRLYFGSFNKAKQIAKLVTNSASDGGKHNKVFTKAIILEDMCAFFRKHGHWPKRLDYEAGQLICSLHPIYVNGGLKILRQEAMKLKEEQELNKTNGGIAIKRIRQQFIDGQPS